MLNSALVPWTIAVLFLIRLVELRLRRSSYHGAIVCPASLPAMVVAGSTTVAAAFVEYFVRKPPVRLGWVAIGLASIGAGFALRAWAARALGNLWSEHIEIRPAHNVVTTGPYQWVRHPIYVSLMLELLGGIITLQASFALIPFVLIYLPVVIWRLRIEQNAMIQRLGNPYEVYMKRVPALVPKVWRRHP